MLILKYLLLIILLILLTLTIFFIFYYTIKLTLLSINIIMRIAQTKKIEHYNCIYRNNCNHYTCADCIIYKKKN